MTRLILLLLTLLFSLSGSAIGEYSDFGRSSFAAKTTGRATTDIIAGPNGLVNVRSTIDRINAGGKFPHRNDGSIFQNREGLLPKQPLGYYKEFVHPTPGAKGPGAQRIIQGQSGELFYTPDHYGSFIPLN